MVSTQSFGGRCPFQLFPNLALTPFPVQAPCWPRNSSEASPSLPFQGKSTFLFLGEGRKADAQPGLQLLFSLPSFPLGTNGTEMIPCTPQFLLVMESGVLPEGNESRLGSQGGRANLEWFLQYPERKPQAWFSSRGYRAFQVSLLLHSPELASRFVTFAPS